MRASSENMRCRSGVYDDDRREIRLPCMVPAEARKPLILARVEDFNIRKNIVLRSGSRIVFIPQAFRFCITHTYCYKYD